METTLIVVLAGIAFVFVLVTVAWMIFKCMERPEMAPKCCL